ncbi:metallophosphoesterase family protein [Microvirga pakistanensis]|uniref:metallophosphoesterase family protein n=1 Tax=Microvirga pakistanensis TaxID=1682650 RepID=UPI00141ADE2A|nr:metallophosphoesterase [Microvirga pakistanensis]
MEIFRLLQVGDVHYPDKENSTPPVDDKDSAFPSRVTGTVGIAPLQTVTKKLSTLIEEQDPHVLAFMGDYTTRGDATGLSDCLSYVQRVIPVSWSGKVASSSVFLIGNHDIDRFSKASPEQRFEDVNAALRNIGFPEAAASKPTRLTWNGTVGRAEVFGINSCLGCGETRFLPATIKEPVSRALDELVANGANPHLLDELIESIDTPAVSEEAIAELLERAAALPNTAVPIICAHHNLLPQATPRIAPYAELLNGGSFRGSLLSLNRPVVFLHGHIHQDPYEVIRSPVWRKSGIISISAPLLRDGFNVVEIAYNDAGFPLGINVTPYRRTGNQIEKKAAIDIPFWTTLAGIENATRHSRELMAQLGSNNIHYCSDLARAVGCSREEMQASIIELRWLGLVEILNAESAPDLWRVTRAI